MMIHSKPQNPIHSSRLVHLSRLMQEAGLEFVVINPGQSLTYLTGLSFHLMERPVVAFFPAGASPAIVLPELEAIKLESLPYPMRAFMYGEEPSLWPEVFKSAVKEIGMDGGSVGVEPTRLRVLELRLLEGAAPTADFRSAENIFSELRICKDEAEVSAIRTAVGIAQRALDAALASIKVGMTEREVAAELVIQLYRAGSDPELPFTPIVSSGPNSANPHVSPSDRPLQVGDLLVIDWGASYQGYISDLTRTFAIGKIDPEFTAIAGIVNIANAAGRALARPKIQAGAVDQAARDVIDHRGYGSFFTHRTGHGIGMEAHEPPYIRQGNSQTLLPGMTFTIEPGIYLPGRGGVRVEDNLVITPTGAECLSDMPRELREIG